MFHCDCHYTCDVCQRVLDAERDQRYVLRITACGCDVGDDADGCLDDDRDYLQEIDDRLIGSGGFDDELIGEGAAGDGDLEIEYDLCSACRERFLHDPLGRRIAPALDFSKN
jgi:hypothetical protein